MQKATLRFARLMKTGKVQEMNLKLMDRSGAELEVSFNGAVIRGESNQLTGILGVCRDLRESKIMRDLEQKTSELEKSHADAQRARPGQGRFLKRGRP